MINPIRHMNSENSCHCPPSGARRGGGGDATTSQGGQWEVVVRRQAEAPADRRHWHDKMQRNNQPGWMRDDYTWDLEGHDRVQGLKLVAGGMTAVKGGRRGAIKKRMAQIKKRMARRQATNMSMMGAADNWVGSLRQSREGRNNQQFMGAVKAGSG